MDYNCIKMLSTGRWLPLPFFFFFLEWVEILFYYLSTDSWFKTSKCIWIFNIFAVQIVEFLEDVGTVFYTWRVVIRKLTTGFWRTVRQVRALWIAGLCRVYSMQRAARHFYPYDSPT